MFPGRCSFRQDFLYNREAYGIGFWLPRIDVNCRGHSPPDPRLPGAPFGDTEGSFRAVRTGRWNTVRHGLEGPLELYGLSVDAYEAKEVAAAHPEVVKKCEAYLR